MSIAVHLGFGQDYVAEAPLPTPDRLEAWCRNDRALEPVHHPHLRQWVQGAGYEQKGCFFDALAALADIDRGNDRLAANLLVWLLLPGATMIGARLGDLGIADLDHVIAVQLWTFARTSGRRHAWASILRNTESAILEEAGKRRPNSQRPEVAIYQDRWGNLSYETPNPVPPTQALSEVLDSALEEGIITPADRALLLVILDVADCCAASRVHGTAAQGLLSHQVTIRVGARVGLSPRTVRRHASRCIEALHAQAPIFRELAA
jgi:hypothetical protein